MCDNCDYPGLLGAAGLDATRNRVDVFEVVGGNRYPLTAQDIYRTVARRHPINRVTVYRILDLLVAHKLVERLSSGGRAARFGMAPNRHHPSHPHFYCTSCGRMDCLKPESLGISADRLEKTLAGEIERIEIRVDGRCRTCLVADRG